MEVEKRIRERGFYKLRKVKEVVNPFVERCSIGSNKRIWVLCVECGSVDGIHG